MELQVLTESKMNGGYVIHIYEGIKHKAYTFNSDCFSLSYAVTWAMSMFMGFEPSNIFVTEFTDNMGG